MYLITYLIRSQLCRTQLVERFERDEFKGNKVVLSVYDAWEPRVTQVFSVDLLKVGGDVDVLVRSAVTTGKRECELVGRLGGDAPDREDLGAISMSELELDLVEYLSKSTDIERSKLLRHLGSGSAATESTSASACQARCQSRVLLNVAQMRTPSSSIVTASPASAPSSPAYSR